jgi:hypothetical protein
MFGAAAFNIVILQPVVPLTATQREGQTEFGPQVGGALGWRRGWGAGMELCPTTFDRHCQARPWKG